MGIRLVKVPMDPVTCRIDLNAVQRAITSNTIMMYGSAPSFPQVCEANNNLPCNPSLSINAACFHVIYQKLYTVIFM